MDFQVILLYSISLESQKILWLSSLLQQVIYLTSRIHITKTNKNTNLTNLLERFSK